MQSVKVCQRTKKLQDFMGEHAKGGTVFLVDSAILLLLSLRIFRKDWFRLLKLALCQVLPSVEATREGGGQRSLSTTDAGESTIAS